MLQCSNASRWAGQTAAGFDLCAPTAPAHQLEPKHLGNPSSSFATDASYFTSQFCEPA